mmetsp:Transcript_11751/g.38672  ORF Transcript_11751/g.38672 Transcript_11751/m.38672 type:complete len:108 (-) Transcript_11751:88-411(-)
MAFGNFSLTHTGLRFFRLPACHSLAPDAVLRAFPELRVLDLTNLWAEFADARESRVHEYHRFFLQDVGDINPASRRHNLESVMIRTYDGTIFNALHDIDAQRVPFMA